MRTSVIDGSVKTRTAAIFLVASFVACAAAEEGVVDDGSFNSQTSALAGEYMLWPATALPAKASDGDTNAVELGVRFKADSNGTIQGIRFYKGRANVGTHTAHLWTNKGTLVGSATFVNESTSGWQTVRFAAPVSVKGGTLYVASYHTDVGRYAADVGYFEKRTLDSGPLHAPADGIAGANGVYHYGASAFPTDTYQSTNYWVDVIFKPASTPPVDAGTDASDAGSDSGGDASVPPPSTGWPGPSNTGVPAGTTLKASGALTVTTSGTILDALSISGTLTINADNVTVKRSRVRSSGWNVIRVQDGRKNVRIEDCEIDGLGGTENAMGVLGPAMVLRVNVFNVENGVTPGSGSVVQDSWIHGLKAPGSPHYDGIQIDGGLANIVVRHNVVDLSEHDQTAAVMVDNYFGPIANVTVDGNRLLGGGYTVYSDGQFSGGPITGVSFTNNRFRKGIWGYALVRGNTVVWSNNVDDGTGNTIGL